MATELNVLELTRDLLSFNTINPPGQERQCAQFLGKLLEDGGFKVAYYDFDESRTSLIARLEGRVPSGWRLKRRVSQPMGPCRSRVRTSFTRPLRR